MRNLIGVCALLLACSPAARGIYGPSLTRADTATDLLACQQSEFAETPQVIRAIKSGDPKDVLRVLGGVLQEWRNTPETSELYSARAFCVHELVPNYLPREGEIGSPGSRWPTDLVTAFSRIGISYFYYDPAAEWTLDNDPVDLNELAAKHLDSRWGRQAFLMMTRLGWSQGRCEEGPNQFLAVIQHGEAFLERYPSTEVSNSIRLEVANAYATWWNLSRTRPNPAGDPPFTPAPYQAGAETAKERAIELYREYLDRQKVPTEDVRKRLEALQRDPQGSKTYDYFCADYED